MQDAVQIPPAAHARASGAVVAAVLTGGCRSTAKARDRTVIEFWSGWTGHEGRVFQSLVDRFNREHPALFVHNFGGVQDDTKTIRAITAGVPPDAFFLWNTGYLGPLAANDAIQPLDGRLAGAGMSERDFVPVSLTLCRYRGRLYGLPVLIDGSALFWNKAAFREAGLDPERPPRTPAELTDYVHRLTRRDAAGHLTRIGIHRRSHGRSCSPAALLSLIRLGGPLPIRLDTARAGLVPGADGRDGRRIGGPVIRGRVWTGAERQPPVPHRANGDDGEWRVDAALDRALGAPSRLRRH